jgi:hypothetical protein
VRTGIFGGVTINTGTSMSNGQIKSDTGTAHTTTKLCISRYDGDGTDTWQALSVMEYGGTIMISHTGNLVGKYAVLSATYSASNTSWVLDVQYLGHNSDSVFYNTNTYELYVQPARTLSATQAEAEAGTNNTKLMTPLRTAEAIAALSGGGGPVIITTAADQTFNSTTPTDVSGMSVVDLDGLSIYKIEFEGYGKILSGSADLEIKYVVNSLEDDMTWIIESRVTSTSVNEGTSGSTNSGTSVVADIGATICYLKAQFYFSTVSGGGTFKFQGEMNAPSSSASILKGATMTVTKIA